MATRRVGLPRRDTLDAGKPAFPGTIAGAGGGEALPVLPPSLRVSFRALHLPSVDGGGSSGAFPRGSTPSRRTRSPPPLPDDLRSARRRKGPRPHGMGNQMSPNNTDKTKGRPEEHGRAPLRKTSRHLPPTPSTGHFPPASERIASSRKREKPEMDISLSLSLAAVPDIPRSSNEQRGRRERYDVKRNDRCPPSNTRRQSPRNAVIKTYCLADVPFHACVAVVVASRFSLGRADESPGGQAAPARRAQVLRV